MKAAKILALIVWLHTVIKCGLAAAVIEVGTFKVPQDASSIQIPVRISGNTNEFATDMAGIVQLGSTLSTAPLITSVNYSGSVWASASGGYFAFTSYPLTNDTYDPNVSLMTPNQRVGLTNGLLFTLTATVVGLPPGEYPIRLAGIVVSGNTNTTRIKDGAIEVPLNISNGRIVVLPRLRLQNLSAGSLTLRFKTFVGKTNFLESTTSLVADAWQTDQRTFMGTGNEVVWSEAAPTNSLPRFYRIRIPF